MPDDKGKSIVSTGSVLVSVLSSEFGILATVLYRIERLLIRLGLVHRQTTILFANARLSHVDALGYVYAAVEYLTGKRYI